MRDFLLTDAPGEWFQKWSVNRDAPEGAGARWVADRADVLLLIADRDALSGDSMGAARNAIQLLGRRLAAERRGRPIALVWTKSDITITPEMETAVRTAVMDPMPDATEFSVSIISPAGDGKGAGAGLLELLNWIVSVRRAPALLPTTSRASDDPLFLYGARS